nr:immunoglobulin heavy chain junction region [Mus musculus]
CASLSTMVTTGVTFDYW